MSPAVESRSPQAVAERVLRTMSDRQERFIEPVHRMPLVVPEALVAELGLPASAFDSVAELWDSAIRHALVQVAAQARQMLA